MRKLGLNFYFYALLAGWNLNSAIHSARAGQSGWFIFNALLFIWMFFSCVRVARVANESKSEEKKP